MKTIEFYKSNKFIQHRLPLCFSPNRAGFSSLADDYLNKKMDLNEHLIKHPARTFFVKVKGDLISAKQSQLIKFNSRARQYEDS